MLYREEHLLQFHFWDLIGSFHLRPTDEYAPRLKAQIDLFQ